MAKAERGTIKWLSNKMKSKGLQRLRWYCQMCSKQCRDENGFKCHVASENHLRRMTVFNQRPGMYVDEFSREFEADFMRLMRTKYCRARVLANSVYCEMIANKEHVHMNSTHWVTLNGFIRHLEETEQVKAEWDHPRGPFIVYIDKEREAREKAAAERLQKYAAPDDVEDRKFRELEKQSKMQQTKMQPELQEESQPELQPVLQPVLQPTADSIEHGPVQEPEQESEGRPDNPGPATCSFTPSAHARLEIRVTSPVKPVGPKAPVTLSFAGAPTMSKPKPKVAPASIACLFKTKKIKHK